MFLIFFFFFKPFVYFPSCWALVAPQTFLWLWRAVAASLVRCTSLSWWRLLLPSTGSRAHGLRESRRVASTVAAPGPRSTGWGAAGHGLRCMQDLPGSGVGLVSPALAGRFFTTEPPGEPPKCLSLFSKCF